jgi:hypothetical protein
LTTLFQDTTGITPVTTPGQTVALMLDKSQVAAPESRRNLATLTESMSASGWSFWSGSVTQSVGTAPNGTNTAVRYNRAGTTESANYFNTPTLNSGTTVTASVFAKLNTAGVHLLLRINDVDSIGTGYVVFNVGAGIIAFTGTTYTGKASIQSVGDGWYRCSITGNVAASPAVRRFDIGLTTATNGSYAGTTGDTILVWGAQFEIGSTATTYEPVGASLPTAWLGNHATQATAAQRPTYGIEPITGRRNFILYSNIFSNAAWVKTSATLTPNATTDPFGGNNAWRFQTSGAGNIKQFTSELPYATNVRQSIYVRSNTGSSQTFALRQYWNNPISLTATTTWQRFDVVSTENFTEGGVFIEGTNLDLHIFGAQLNTGTSPSTYQETTTRFNVTEAGVVSKSYLFFDGVDDGMVTGTITPGVDKVQVFAGIRKLSDATLGMIVEYSAAVDTNNGTFFLAGSRSGGGAPNYGFRNKGTVLQDADGTGYVAPITNVLGALGDISGDLATLRVNAIQVTQTTGDQGTGNFLSYPLYIGRRGGTVLPYNGNIYSLITRFSAANLDTTTITSTEKWVNSKTGAY